MPGHRVLLVVLLAAGGATAAAAQQPDFPRLGPPPSTAPGQFHAPALSQAPPLTAISPAAVPPRVFIVPVRRPAEVAVLRTGNTCFVLRSYNFTDDDLKARVPRPSGASICSPASVIHYRDAEATPAK